MPTTPYPLPDRDLVRRLCEAMAKVDPEARRKLLPVIEGRADLKSSMPVIRRMATLVAFGESTKPSRQLRQELAGFLRTYGPMSRGSDKEARKRVEASFNYSDYLELEKAAAHDNVSPAEFMRNVTLVAVRKVLE